VEAYSGAVWLTLELWKLRLRVMETHPGAVEAHFAGVKAGAMEAHLGGVSYYLGGADTHPGIIDAYPGVIQIYLESKRLILEVWRPPAATEDHLGPVEKIRLTLELCKLT
jgi:hypothetical protein